MVRWTGIQNARGWNPTPGSLCREGHLLWKQLTNQCVEHVLLRWPQKEWVQAESTVCYIINKGGLQCNEGKMTLTISDDDENHQTTFAYKLPLVVYYSTIFCIFPSCPFVFCLLILFHLKQQYGSGIKIITLIITTPELIFRKSD